MLQMLDFYHFFRLSCSSHHNPSPFVTPSIMYLKCLMNYHIVVVNKIVTVYLILRVFYYLLTSNLRCQKIYLFAGLKYID